MSAGSPHRASNERNPSRYVPALDYDWLTPAYDALIRLTMPEHAFKSRLIELAAPHPGHIVLDLGCGTGTLAIMLKGAHADVMVIGIDGDPNILSIAARKLERAQVDVTLQAGLAFELPYANASLDRVVSSLVFHHLALEDKRRSLVECFRVLRGGGELHIADWGKPHTKLMRVASWGMQLFEGLQRTRENVQGRLPQLCEQAGFERVAETARFATVFGTLSIHRAVKSLHD